MRNPNKQPVACGTCGQVLRNPRSMLHLRGDRHREATAKMVAAANQRYAEKIAACTHQLLSDNRERCLDCSTYFPPPIDAPSLALIISAHTSHIGYDDGKPGIYLTRSQWDTVQAALRAVRP